jgi:hypothetical protein
LFDDRLDQVGDELSQWIRSWPRVEPIGVLQRASIETIVDLVRRIAVLEQTSIAEALASVTGISLPVGARVARAGGVTDPPARKSASPRARVGPRADRA